MSLRRTDVLLAALVFALPACSGREGALGFDLAGRPLAFVFLAHNVPAGWRLSVEAAITETNGVEVKLREVTIGAVDLWTGSDLGSQVLDAATLEARDFSSVVPASGRVVVGALFFPEERPKGPLRVSISATGVDAKGHGVEGRATVESAIDIRE